MDVDSFINKVQWWQPIGVIKDEGGALLLMDWYVVLIQQCIVHVMISFEQYSVRCNIEGSTLAPLHFTVDTLAMARAVELMEHTT